MWIKVSPFVRMLQNLFQSFLRQSFHFNEVVRTSKPELEVMDPDGGVLRPGLSTIKLKKILRFFAKRGIRFKYSKLNLRASILA